MHDDPKKAAFSPEMLDRTPVEWSITNFDGIGQRRLYALLKLRSEVFVVEQNCVYQDLDDVDYEATHLIASAGPWVIACARWYPHPEGTALGRIITKGAVRSRGFGKELMRRALEAIGPRRTVVMSAQAYLDRFYRGFGFVARGEGYLEDGIPHRFMVRTAVPD